MEYIVYKRVSTKDQHNGIQAQQMLIDGCLSTNGGNIVAEDEERVSGAKNNREELKKALADCKRAKATLLVAKLDRLSRKVSFIAQLLESKIELKVATMPTADTFTLHIYACLAEKERQEISARVTAALKIVKAKGKQLGSPKNKEYAQQAKDFALTIKPYYLKCKAAGIKSLRAICKEFNSQGLKTFQNKEWTHKSLQRSLSYINLS